MNIFADPILLPTDFGVFEATYFSIEKREGVILTPQGKTNKKEVLVRMHSSCLFSESFNAIDCDCSDQLLTSMHTIANQGGIIFYLYDEGRGLGLYGKFQAIRLQQQHKLHTAEAFEELDSVADPRDYSIYSHLLSRYIDKEKNKIILLTNNSQKVIFVKNMGFDVTRKPLIILKNSLVCKYFLEKKTVLGHLVDYDD